MKNTSIILKMNSGFPWFNYDDKIFVKGYIYDSNNKLNKNEDFAEYFLQFWDDRELLIEKIKKVNGCFLMIFKYHNEIIIASDRILTFPIFYSVTETNIIISDCLEEIQKINKCQINLDFVEEIRSSGFVSGRDIIFNNSYQLRAYELVIISQEQTNHFSYSNFNILDKTDKGLDYYQKEYEKVLDGTAERFIQGLDNRTALIPLSGGFDSRLIAAMLKVFGYENVICYTYGKSDSYEITISKKVAQKLGYKWYWVEYNESLINGFNKVGIFDSFVKYASNLNVIPHLQDYFAFKYLLENELIDKNMIVTPGSMGRYYYGFDNTVRKKVLEIDSNRTIKMIMEYDFQYSKIKSSEELKQKILSLLSDGCVIEQLDDWIFKERWTKFMVNALRTYEFFGFEHRIPILDSEMQEFFKNLPLKYKLDNNFYHNESFRNYFIITGTDFSKSAYYNIRTNLLLTKLKEITLVQKFLKKFAHLLFKKYQDVNNFELIIKQLLPDVKIKGKSDIWFNGNIAGWYVDNYICNHF